MALAPTAPPATNLALVAHLARIAHVVLAGGKPNAASWKRWRRREGAAS
jgi:hypothetical protein